MRFVIYMLKLAKISLNVQSAKPQFDIHRKIIQNLSSLNTIPDQQRNLIYNGYSNIASYSIIQPSYYKS